MLAGAEGARGRGGQGTGQVAQGLWATGRTPKEVGAMEGLGQRREGPDMGAHRCPLVAAVGRTDCQ